LHNPYLHFGFLCRLVTVARRHGKKLLSFNTEKKNRVQMGNQKLH
jgi:hypothetical protein